MTDLGDPNSLGITVSEGKNNKENNMFKGTKEKNLHLKKVFRLKMNDHRLEVKLMKRDCVGCLLLHNILP